MEKRKPGRPKSDVHKEWRSISVPKELWDKLSIQAKCEGTTIGKLATEHILGNMVQHDHPERCHGASDGECSWVRCPQLRDNEPAKTGRHCPLDNREAEEEYEF